MTMPATSAHHVASAFPEGTFLDAGATPVARSGSLRAAEPDHLAALAAGLKPLSSPVRLRLLRFLTEPRYLEEIASHLHLTRQGAQRHVRLLQQAGLVERRPGSRPSGAVVEYSLRPHTLFALHEALETLSGLRSKRSEMMHRTQPGLVPGGSASGSWPCLVLVRGPRWGEHVQLRQGRERAWVIGRDDRCEVVVDYDPYASNRHAELRCAGGKFTVSDLRSTNGTTLNQAPIPRGGSVTAGHGDLIGVGHTLLLLWEQPPHVGGG
jgi:DNA-binding transcriptional ArsR family regulator